MGLLRQGYIVIDRIESTEEVLEESFVEVVCSGRVITCLEDMILIFAKKSKESFAFFFFDRHPSSACSIVQ